MMPLPSVRRTTDDLDLELELPALDGVDGDEEGGASFDDPLGTEGREEHDRGAYDDATGEDGPIDDLAFTEGKETGWLVDAEGAAQLDIGGFDLGLPEEGKILGDDEPDLTARPHDDFITTDEASVVDAGEEGPLDEDEELREQDLPPLDADDEGDVPDELLFDRALLGVASAAEDLRWADRAWERVAEPAAFVLEDPDDAVVPSDDASARDAAWKKLDEGGRVMATATIPGGSVVLALPSGEKVILVRVLPDGEARILAEIEMAEEKAVVASLRWDGAGGHLVVTGNFGVEAYRPA